MLQFVLFLHAQGIKTLNPTGQKVMPSVAETLMRLHGTPEGQRAYPNDFYFRVSADAKPTFVV